MDTPAPVRRFVSRGGDKLDAALAAFVVDPTARVCADLGCNVGGFTDCLLRHGATRVYAVDTGYGALDYGLRRDARVVVMERTNAMHVELPEPVTLVAIDVAWTRQEKIIPAAARLLADGGDLISLIKPAYELGPKALRDGRLSLEQADELLASLRRSLAYVAGLRWIADIPSPVVSGKKNPEYLAHFRKSASPA
ncbi:MAG: Hemolysin A [Phycisphaerae bacterium]|nr:Hemolysin A [Phycisphaerae bacterium]